MTQYWTNFVVRGSRYRDTDLRTRDGAHRSNRWEKTDYRICEACVMALQELGGDMVLATARESESMVRLSLMETHGGEIEVETSYGLIDLLTDERIYEIKHVKNWKDALKVLLFSFEFPDRKPTVYLFGSTPKQPDRLSQKPFRDLVSM